MKITHALLGEHAVLYALLDRVTSGALRQASLDAWREFLSVLQGTLATHAQLEDALLFPALEKHGLDTGPLPVMRAEHAEIERLISAALAADTAARAADHAGAMAQLTVEHFIKEEQVLFVMAQQLLGDAQLEQLGARWATERDVHVAR